MVAANTVDAVLQDQKYMAAVSKGPQPDYPYYKVVDGERVEISRSEYKEHQRKFVTVRNQRVPMCGHEFSPQKEPRHRNCDSCWFAFFQVHGELTQACDEVFSQFGEAGLRQLRGPKFTKNFLSFMSTIAQWKKASEQAAAINQEPTNNVNEQSPSGPGSDVATAGDSSNTNTSSIGTDDSSSSEDDSDQDSLD